MENENKRIDPSEASIPPVYSEAVTGDGQFSLMEDLKMKERYIFEQSAGDKAFLLRNGGRIDSIRELYEKLEDMHEESFSHHVNQERNDFGNWIKDVYNHTEFADNISGLSDKSDIKSAIGNFMSACIHKRNKRKNNFMLGIREKIGSMASGIKNIHKKAHHSITKKRTLKISMPSFFRFRNKQVIHQPVQDKLTAKKNIPSTIFAGILDFTLGLTVGALSTMLLMNIL